MNEESKEMEKEEKPKRGRKKKHEESVGEETKEQNKFFIDVSKEPENKELIQNLLSQANNKTYGREIILKDLVLTSLPKLQAKDIEKIQDESLTKMEKVQRLLDDHNKKTNSNLSLDEFLVKKLNIN